MSEEIWYIAVLVVESSVGDDPTYEPLVDLQHRLVRASNAEDAHRKSLELGGSAEHSYENPDGEMVRWRFAGLHDLREVQDQDLVHGAEVYSRLRRRAAHHYVVPKDRLTELWVEANKDKTAREILDEADE
ncbi:MAG: DUF4288 domain-containing protein [Byssovorax sp.]